MSVVEQNYSILFYGTNVYTAIGTQCVVKFSDLGTKKSVRTISLKLATLIDHNAI